MAFSKAQILQMSERENQAKMRNVSKPTNLGNCSFPSLTLKRVPLLGKEERREVKVGTRSWRLREGWTRRDGTRGGILNLGGIRRGLGRRRGWMLI